MLFQWGCPPFHFLIHDFNSNSSPILTYSNIFLFTNASFHLLIYSFNATFSDALNIFLLNTAFFNPLWYVHINIWIGGVTCCLNFSQNRLSLIRLRCIFLFFVLFYLFIISTSAAICFLNWYSLIVSIKRHFSSIYNPYRQLNVCCMKSKNIWVRFIASSSWISMSYFPD